MAQFPPARTVPSPEPRPGRVLAEVAWLFVTGLLVLLAADRLSRMGGIGADVSSALSAGFFLLAPVTMLRRHGLDPARFLGLSLDALGRSLATCLLVAAIVFPAYILAFAGWAAWIEDRPLRMPADPWTDFPALVRGRPDVRDAPAAVLAWTQEDVLFVLNASPASVPVRIRGCQGTLAGLVRRDGRLFLRDAQADFTPGEGVDIPLAAGAGLRCEVSRDFTVTLPGTHPPLRAGEGLRPVDGDVLNGSRSVTWLLELLLLHLVAVALPEEVFYRGWVQGRLAAVFRRRLRLLGVDMGGHVVVASALFALSHLVAIPAPFRLAVFFPGLLFGWLRERTGSLVAPVLMHALSNVLLAVLVRFQG